MSIITHRYKGGLTVQLAAGEIFEVRRNTGRVLLRATMGDDEASITLETLPVTTHDTYYDLGNTGWTIKTVQPIVQGLPHDIRPTTAEDIKTGTRKRTQRKPRGKRT